MSDYEQQPLNWQAVIVGVTLGILLLLAAKGISWVTGWVIMALLG